MQRNGSSRVEVVASDAIVRDRMWGKVERMTKLALR